MDYGFNHEFDREQGAGTPNTAPTGGYGAPQVDHGGYSARPVAPPQAAPVQPVAQPSPYAAWQAQHTQQPSGAGPAYNAYNPANAQSPLHTPYEQARQQAQQAQQVQGAQMPETAPKKKSHVGKAVASIGLVVACAAAGFGGGVVSTHVVGGNAQPTVVYQAPAAGEGGSKTASSGSGALSVSEISQKASPSVVSITTEAMMSDFFGQRQAATGAGSGVIISEDGTIITNNHVVAGAEKLLVTLADGTEYEGTVLGADPQQDIAVVKIEATGLKAAVIGNSDEVQVGDFCLAIGNSLGELSGTVTNGIISATQREVEVEGTTMNLFQMSAAVSPGNSGGGLFNERGELIGIVNAKTSGNGAEGLGFSIPVNDAMTVAQDLIENGYVTGRPVMGVQIVELSNEEAAMNGFASGGVYIAVVDTGSGAAAAGVEAGDRVISADGTVVNSQSDLTNVLKEKKAGETLELSVDRDGHQMSLTVTLGESKGA